MLLCHIFLEILWLIIFIDYQHSTIVSSLIAIGKKKSASDDADYHIKIVFYQLDAGVSVGVNSTAAMGGLLVVSVTIMRMIPENVMVALASVRAVFAINAGLLFVVGVAAGVVRYNGMNISSGTMVFNSMRIVIDTIGARKIACE